ncbi:MAG: AbrB/MazE/SpoVT family DNA-binding domain-containing protein [Minisyncoccota bacterium]
MRRKISESNVRKLTRMGAHSLGLTLPIELVEALGWREKQKVTVKKVNGALVVRDARTTPRLRTTRKTKKR